MHLLKLQDAKNVNRYFIRHLPTMFGELEIICWIQQDERKV